MFLLCVVHRRARRLPHVSGGVESNNKRRCKYIENTDYKAFWVVQIHKTSYKSMTDAGIVLNVSGQFYNVSQV